MNNTFTGFRNGSIGLVYRIILKPLLFRQNPEKVHDGIIKLGQSTANNPVTRSLIRLAFGYRNRALQQIVDGVKYNNPIGLAAGFDKNAQLTQLTPLVGFGFEEIGSVTGEACQGNDKPRLWRLPKSKSLVVYYGLMNDGAEILAKKLRGYKFKIPIGVSIAKTNSPATAKMADGVKDYTKAYTTMKTIGDYVTINISCPNAYGGQPFTDRKSLDALLKAIDKVRLAKPHYIKLSPDLSEKQIDDIIKLAKKYKIDGFITSNLTKNRDNLKIVETDLPKQGGLSGKVVQDLADSQLAYIYKRGGADLTLIGCGGVFTAEDAYKKILHGASLIQMITGMIYMGPQQISEINRGLVKLLQRNGYGNVSEAIGKAVD